MGGDGEAVSRCLSSPLSVRTRNSKLSLGSRSVCLLSGSGHRSDQARQRAECWVAGADLGESGDRILQAGPVPSSAMHAENFLAAFFGNAVSKSCKPIWTRSLPQDRSGWIPAPAPRACASLRPSLSPILTL